MKTVLVVDDQKDFRDILSFALKANGFYVLEAGSADEALQVFQKQQVDVLITDYLMPGKSGAELVRNLRTKKILTPVFFITGYSECPRQELIDLKVNATIFKPFDTEEVVTQIKSLFK